MEAIVDRLSDQQKSLSFRIFFYWFFVSRITLILILVHSRGTKRKQRNVIIEQEVEPSHVPSHLIQIKASRENLNERICNFLNLKRDEINRSNVRDFCRKEASSEVETSCARIESILLKRKDAKGHLQGKHLMRKV